MFWGLMLANLIDLDHIYMRLIGKVGWFASACSEFGKNCSFEFYPLHNLYFIIPAIIFSSLVFSKNKKIKFVGWLSLGIAIHLALDYIHILIGFGI